MAIRNMENDNIHALIALSEAPFDFYLTGSRFFGGVHSNSDWDFFVQDVEEVQAWLRKHGFEVFSESYHEDPQCAIVYRHNSANIDVQCTFNVEIKKRAQKAIAKHQLLRATPKGTHRLVWRTVYDAILNT